MALISAVALLAGARHHFFGTTTPLPPPTRHDLQQSSVVPLIAAEVFFAVQLPQGARECSAAVC